MQIQCPHCNKWSDTTKGKCPICGGDLFSDIEQPTGHASFCAHEDDTEYHKRLARKIWKIIILVLALSAVVGIYYLLSCHAKIEAEAEALEKDTPKLSKDEGDIYKIYARFACLPPFDIETAPQNADQDTILQLQRELYNKHLLQHDCNEVEITQKIGKKSVRRNNAAGWFYHAEDPYRKSFHSRFDGCYGHAFGPATDTLLLYRIQPQPNHKYQFVINKHKSHYFELNSMYSVIPVDKSLILYGFDEEPFSQSELHKLDDDASETDYYYFEVSQQNYEEMHNHKTFKFVMHIRDRKEQNYIIYRVFPLDQSLIKEGEYETPQSFEKACSPLPPC